MKNIIMPFLAYLIVCIGMVLYPPSEGYNTVGWKLLVAQPIAIPVLIITYITNKRLSSR